jgi:hypothetical protein
VVLRKSLQPKAEGRGLCEAFALISREDLPEANWLRRSSGLGEAMMCDAGRSR